MTRAHKNHNTARLHIEAVQFALHSRCNVTKGRTLEHKSSRGCGVRLGIGPEPVRASRRARTERVAREEWGPLPRRRAPPAPRLVLAAPLPHWRCARIIRPITHRPTAYYSDLFDRAQGWWPATGVNVSVVADVHPWTQENVYKSDRITYTYFQENVKIVDLWWWWTRGL